MAAKKPKGWRAFDKLAKAIVAKAKPKARPRLRKCANLGRAAIGKGAV